MGPALWIAVGAAIIYTSAQKRKNSFHHKKDITHFWGCPFYDIIHDFINIP